MLLKSSSELVFDPGGIGAGPVVRNGGHPNPAVRTTRSPDTIAPPLSRQRSGRGPGFYDLRLTNGCRTCYGETLDIARPRSSEPKEPLRVAQGPK